jgi:hypothetical protein
MKYVLSKIILKDEDAKLPNTYGFAYKSDGRWHSTQGHLFYIFGCHSTFVDIRTESDEPIVCLFYRVEDDTYVFLNSIKVDKTIEKDIGRGVSGAQVTTVVHRDLTIVGKSTDVIDSEDL